MFLKGPNLWDVFARKQAVWKNTASVLILEKNVGSSANALTV